ncbi:hypothetical protein BAOM_2997 [Peribacillus asahii]|uniref:Uncharacterized protein n=1 Tax=Peribacillus asahii TaxID=228899 RepID=A0A3Q9RP19_9BACI|nr:hypothetical protein [Peribacillus asahii]AZV43606.1 hypothetical protein BAOM_2997 [Peribacillus asahii]
MNQITKEALLFLEKAKKGFEENKEWTTYRDEEENFIALRTGMFEDCITVYELSNPVGIFTEQLTRQNNKVIDYDDYGRLKEIEKTMNELRYYLNKDSHFTSLNELYLYIKDTLNELERK